MTLREDSSPSSGGDDVEEVSLQGPADGTHYKTDRRSCPHCHQLVSLKTFKTHKRLYYNEVCFRLLFFY